MRAAVALVPQDVALFNDTLGANIAFARPDADETQIWAAAEAAELADFIRGLPEGMQTKVGERGLKLSGGERQRVGIARALLADPCILILDEATSALDAESEAIIHRNMRAIAKGRTVMIIAHRLSAIRMADRIITMENGAITEMGTHDTLMAAGGRYAQLWRTQMHGDVQEAGA